MRKIFAYFTSLLVLFSATAVKAQDTIDFPLKIRAGFDIAGPVKYMSDKNNFNLEGFVSVDRNEKMAYVLEGGYLDYSYSQYNYEYLSRGMFLRAGTDFNLLKANVSQGRYYAGIGLRYGFSLFNTETPFFEHENYWGQVSSSIGKRTHTGHFLEVAPGVRTELFRNVTIGWTLRMRLLISGGGGRDLKPIYFPGFGQGGKIVNAGINYYITWNIPFRKIKAVLKPDKPEEEELPDEEGLPSNTGQTMN